MASGGERWPPTVMSFTFVPALRSITDTVPSASFETSPLPSFVIAAPYGKRPVATYLISFVLVSIPAAWSARLSATRIVLPAVVRARSRGPERGWRLVGGKFCGALVPLGGG